MYTHPKATTKTCRYCQAITLIGVDANVAGITVAVDVTPLTRFGELVAEMTGRAVYELRNQRLVDRPKPHKTRPSRNPVLPAHTCQPVPTTWIAPPQPVEQPSEQPTW